MRINFFSFIFALIILYLIIVIFIYALPFLIIIGIIFLIITGIAWLSSYIFNKTKKHDSYDSEGLRKTKATIIDIKPSEGSDKNNE